MRVLPFLSLTSVASVGCTFEGPADALLLVPEDIEVAWDLSFNAEEDGVAAVIPVDAMLYDPATGEPLVDALLEFQSLESGVVLVLPEEVVPLTPEESLEMGWWDVRRERYVEFEPEDVTLLDRIRVRTDATGLARVYAVADSFPEDLWGELSPVAIVVSDGVTDDTFLLLPR